MASRYSRSGRRYNQGTIDFTKITQPWLRHPVLEWARAMDPDTFVLRRTVDSCLRASVALRARPGGGHDPAGLSFADMHAVVDAFKDARKPDGELCTFTVRRDLLTQFFQLLDFGRKAGARPDGFRRPRSVAPEAGSRRALRSAPSRPETPASSGTSRPAVVSAGSLR